MHTSVAAQNARPMEADLSNPSGCSKGIFVSAPTIDGRYRNVEQAQIEGEAD